MIERWQVRPLLPSDAVAFQGLRLRGLRECPTAFASSFEEECEEPLSVVARRLAAHSSRATFGAFGGAALVGITGVQREELCKLAHKALVWGVYVAPEFRKRSVGRLLLARALEHAFSVWGVRQVNLSVNAANAPAIALYEAAGFRSFGVERGFMLVNGVLQDEIHMVHVDEEP